MAGEIETRESSLKPAVQRSRCVGKDPVLGIPRICSPELRRIDTCIVQIQDDSRGARQVFHGNISRHGSAGKTSLQICNGKPPIRIPIGIFATEFGCMPCLKIYCVRCRVSSREEISFREFQESGGGRLAGKRFVRKKVIQEWDLCRPRVFELSRNFIAEDLVNFSLKLHLVLAGCDHNPSSHDSGARVVQICGECVRDRELHVRRTVQNAVVSQVSDEHFAPGLIIQDRCEIGERQINIDPALVQ